MWHYFDQNSHYITKLGLKVLEYAEAKEQAYYEKWLDDMKEVVPNLG